MKKHTDKELQAMSAEELETVREQAMREFTEAGDELTAFLRKEDLLKQISSDEKYRYRVFWGPGIYFVIVNGGILTISDDASCSPRGGWFPAIVTGPTDAERECLQKMMKTLEFDETFFSELIEECGEFDEDYVEDFFGDNDNEESLRIYRKIERKVKTGKTPFASMEQLVSALSRIELDDDLYYEWEGEYIHFFNNICDTGEAPGSYENLSTADWVDLLENIDSHIVTAD